MEPFDLIVIGGGPGGYVAAIRASQLGMKTALAEKRQLGGTCLNRGCIPTKSLMHSAELYQQTLHLETFGLSAESVSFDFGRVHQRKEQVTAALRGGVEQLLRTNKVTLLSGAAVITGPGEVTVEGETFRGTHILAATGSSPAKPPIPGIDLEGVLTSDEILENGQFYDRLTVIGGGVIGVEMASIYAALGCRVTIIEYLDRILPMMDREISQNLSMILKKRGVEVYTSSRVEQITERGGVLECEFEQKGEKCSVTGEAVLAAVGRRPVTNGLFAPEITPETERGFLKADERFRTSVPGIFAVGDVIGGIQLAHKAEAEGIAAVEMMAGMAPSVDVGTVPSCVYTNPEIAAVGWTAEEAKERGHRVKTGKYVMSGNAKTLMENQERSFVKLVFDKDTDVLLGAHLMCSRATDMIGELTTAVSNRMTRKQLLAGMKPHPTFSEGIQEALEAADGHSIHSAPSRQ